MNVNVPKKQTISARAGIQDIDVSALQGKVVLVRVDYSVPLNIPGSSGLPGGLPGAMHVVANDSKMRASLRTIQYLLDAGGIVMLLSHLGRPDMPDHADEDDVSILSRGDGKASSALPVRWYKAALTLRGLMYKLTELLVADYPTVDITFCDACIGPDRHEQIEAAKAKQQKTGRGQVLLLENVRFYREELLNTPSFCAALAQDVEFFVNEAFSVSHRAHASIVGIKAQLKNPIAVSGYHFQAEQRALEQCFSDPKRPFACIVGGKKISSKIACIRSLLSHANKLLIGGAMAFTFLRALGTRCGHSPVEEACVHEAQNILALAQSRGVKIVLPCDFVCSSSADAEECKAGSDGANAVFTCKAGDMPDTAIGFDIGPDTLQLFRNELRDAAMVLWNGPVGKCEVDAYSEGTNKVIDHLADMTAHGAVTVVCGGDTVASVEKHLHLNDKARLTVSQGGHGPRTRNKDSPECFSHMSLAGGAALEFLASPGNPPGIGVLSYTAEIPETCRRSEGDRGDSAPAEGRKMRGTMLLAQPDLH